MHNPDGDDGQFFFKYFRGAENTMFLASASGKRLKNWQEWMQLPEKERMPGAVKVPERSSKKSLEPDPPDGALIARVYIRTFVFDAKTEPCYEKVLSLGGGRAESETSRDHLWLTKDEWQSLVPDKCKEGDHFPIPGPVLNRIIRQHLIFAPARVVGVAWAPQALRKVSLTAIVEKATPDALAFRLDGSVLLVQPANSGSDDSGLGYNARLGGRLTFDRKSKTFERFDLVAFGKGWDKVGDWRQGRSPDFWIGFAFELVPPAAIKSNSLLAPPYLLLREGNDYFGKGK
jgi:hypothetical protein